MPTDDQKKQALKVTAADLQTVMANDPGAALQVKSLMQLRQAMYDLLGAYPQESILPYAYTVSLTSAKGNAISANGTQQGSIRITADSAFIATQITGVSTGAYLVFPRTDSSDRQLVNEAIHSSAYVGTAERPHYLPKPLLLQANTTLSFDFTDLSGGTNEVRLSYIGYKVYRRS